jgi:hypothetical protein
MQGEYKVQLFSITGQEVGNRSGLLWETTGG